MAEELRRLPGPYELLELADRDSITLKVVGWERGTMIIHPKWPGAPESKEIPVLRVHVPVEVKPYPPGYYDITSKTLQAQFIPLLARPDYKKWSYRIQAFGVAPRKRFTLERLPY